FGEEIVFAGSGVLALDGDREHAITRDTPISVTIRRDGPYVIDITAAMRHVVAEGMMLIAK
ncbi:MAG TPA: ATP-NAD kinase, partial [Gammaproteobacteria bacterium]|nr:ATP-NAD kinase [Gammaproteobacteria bacterium]